MVDISLFDKTQTVAHIKREHVESITSKLETTEVVLTGFILNKNRAHHPDVNELYDKVVEIINDPDVVCRNRNDTEVAIYYRRYPALLGEEKFLRVVVWLKTKDSPEEYKNSIHSFRIARRNEVERDIALDLACWRR
ncbi:hypothetical protein H8E77_15765 [bacterium]|nr:hypothetical protein [bacterium]